MCLYLWITLDRKNVVYILAAKCLNVLGIVMPRPRGASATIFLSSDSLFLENCETK
jgi:hypothetical protein